MGKITRRALLGGATFAAGAAAGVAFGPPDPPRGRRLPAPFLADSPVLDDASRLNPTPVARHLVLDDSQADMVERLRAELAAAKDEGRAFAASAARHSMGGQSLPRDGHAATLAGTRCEPDSGALTFKVPAGIRWSSVIAALDPIGFSPKVMQSNNDFGVASTFCVNAHGWPAPFGPFGTTVRSLRLMLADGEIVTCSPTENADLFALTMGGYGLSGVVLDLEAEMVPNEWLVPRFERMDADRYGTRCAELMQTDPAIRMVYGRLDVSEGNFFEDALLVTYRPAGTADEPDPAGSGGVLSTLSREIFRAQIGSESVKKARWGVETRIGPLVGGGKVTRNSLLNEPVSNLAGRDRRRTDILHEYFVPPEAFDGFMELCRAIIPSSYQDLLNVTLRYVKASDDCMLSYAATDRIAAVMLFSQERTARAEADMGRMTRGLIEAALETGGSYYLPYRLHANDDQLERAYPGLDAFVEAKRVIDPDLVFRNALWDRYLAHR